jgi:hypothetical protein
LFLLSRIGAANEQQISARPVPDEAGEFLLSASTQNGTLSLIVLLQHAATACPRCLVIRQTFCPDGTFNDGVSCTGAGAPVSGFRINFRHGYRISEAVLKTDEAAMTPTECKSKYVYESHFPGY